MSELITAWGELTITSILSSKNVSLTSSSSFFKTTDNGLSFSPNTIKITPVFQGDVKYKSWQYSVDGGETYQTVYSGTHGFAISKDVLIITQNTDLLPDGNTVLTIKILTDDDNVYDIITISKLYDTIELGDGRNLLLKTSNYRNDSPLQKTGLKKDDYSVYDDIATSIELEAGKNYVLQAKTDGKWVTKHDVSGSNTSEKKVGLWLVSTNTNTFLDMSKGYAIFTPTVTTMYKLRVNLYSDGVNSYTIKLWDIKLEKGSFPTGWSAAPEDIRESVISTKNEISSVSEIVDQNKKAIEQRVSKTTYDTDLKVIRDNVDKANDGINKWRYEIYPKSLFKSEDQSKYTVDIFATNQNLTPSQTVLLDDTKLSTGMDYGDQHIAYALTFIKMSAKKDVTTKMFNDDGASLYVNGSLVSTHSVEYTNGYDISFTLAQGWNCIEVVVNEVAEGEGFKFSTALSALSECQIMNCYYGTPIARQSRITNQLVQNTTDINGVSGSVQKVMSVVGGTGKIEEFESKYNEWKNNLTESVHTIGSTYVTKDDFDGLEIGGRNLLTKDECNMSKWQNLYPAHCKITSNDYSNHVDYVPTSGEWEIVYKKISITKGQKYILSFDYKINKAYNYLSGQKYGVYLSTSVPGNAQPTNIIANGEYVIENTVTNIKRGMVTFTAPADTLYIVINGGCIADNQTGLSFEFNKWKLEKGNKATDWTPAPEDVNGKIENVETVATQTANQIGWLINKNGSTASSLQLTQNALTAIAENINLTGKITFSSFDSAAQKKINDIDTKAGSAQTAASSANSKIDGLEIGGQNLIRKDGLGHSTETSYTYDKNTDTYTIVSPAGGNTWGYGLSVKRTDVHKYVTVPYGKTYILSFEVKVPQTLSVVPDVNNYPVGADAWSDNDNDDTSKRVISNNKDIPANIWTKVTVKWENTSSSNTKKVDLYDCTALGLYTNNCSSPVTWYIRNVKGEIGNKASAWSPSPYDTLQDAKNYSSSAVDWVTSNGNNAKSASDWVSSNGQKSQNLYSMVSKWTDNAVSDTTQFNGGWIKTNTITASKIAIGDFTNYADDPCFEKGIYTGGGSFAISTEQKYVGTKSMKMRAGAKSYYSTLISKDFELSAGEKVYVEYYIYRNSADKNAGVGIASSASDHGAVVYDISGQQFATPDVADKIWTKISYIATANRAGMWHAVFKLGSNDTLNGDWYLDNVTIRKMTTGNLIVDGAITADKIATDAIKSRNYISSSGAEGSYLNLADGTFDSKYLKWDSTGKLTATSGTIGRYRITDTYLVTGTGATTAGMGGNQAFWAGNSDSNSAPFRVSYGGQLVASGATLTSANVSGTITATDGQIGKYKITDNWLITGSGTTCTGIGGSGEAFWAGAENSTVAPFRVSYDGKLYATNADITGKIKATSGTLQNCSFENGDDSIGLKIYTYNNQWRIRNTSEEVWAYFSPGEIRVTSPSAGFVYAGLTESGVIENGKLLSAQYAAKSHVHWYVEGGDYRVGIGSSTARFTTYKGNSSDSADNTLSLGSSNARWSRVYAANASISTSDQRMKENIQAQDERYEKLFDNLRPVTYKWKGSDHDRVHTGFIAQQVKAAMDVAGLTALDFGAFCYDNFYGDPEWKPSSTEGMTDRYSLAYEEFISLNTHMIQKTRKELSESNQEIINLKKENAELKETLKQIMKKLNMQ